MKADAGKLALGILGIASLIALWSLTSALGWVSPDSLPGPGAVFANVPYLIGSREFHLNLIDTMMAWFLSLTIASISAIVLGLLIGVVRWLSRPAILAVNTFRAIPATALIPLGILLFGLGLGMKVAISLYASFWIVLISTVYGVATVEPMRLDAARSMQWSWLQTHRYVTLPSALPSIATGIRIASGVTLVVVISTELLGAKFGVGNLLVQYQQALRIDVVYAGTFLVGLLGVLLYSLLSKLESTYLKWVHHD